MTLSAMLRKMLRKLSLALPLAAGLAAPAIGTTVLPDFATATFLPGQAITNALFPLAPRRNVTLASNKTGDGINTERFTVNWGGPGPKLLGVATTTQLDQAFIDDVLVETTFDYFAQDTAGNVWYMGEDVTNYEYDEAGNLTGTNAKSSWRAGVNGALPGWQMPVNPAVGMSFYQEFAQADQAVDEALILATGQTLTFAGVTYQNVITVFESSAADPDLREIKYYSPGFGIIRTEEGVDGDYRNPALTFDIVQPAPVPVPAALPLLGGALAAIFGITRRRRRAA
jgi:hypothetical protein